MYALKCPECGRPDLDYKTEGECHCRNCGLVVADNMPQNDYYTKEASIGLQLVEGKIVKGAWLLTSKEKNLYHAKKNLDLLASKLILPDYIKDQAYYLYQKAVYKNLCIGRDNNSILYACVYAACNLNNIPKTALEITEYSDIDKKHLLRAYSLLQRELGFKRVIYDPIDLLPRFITNLNLSNKTLTKATQILSKIKGTAMYSGKNPKSIIAASIYIAAKLNKERITQRDLANKIGVMEVTIRKRYKEILNRLQINLLHDNRELL